MWKDFLYFSRNERLAIVALLILIVLIQIALWTTDYWMPHLPEKITRASALQLDIKNYKDSIAKHGTYSEKDKQAVHLAVFDPNRADSSTLVALGLRSYVAKNILKYRKKGGVFRTPEDLGRIYGISPGQFAKLKPFIRINHIDRVQQSATSAMETPLAEPRVFALSTNQPEMREGSDLVPPTTASAKTLSLDVNRIDTTALQQLKGVGAVTAGRITRYRNRLGGFYSLSQLSEIKGLYPETVLRLEAALKVDTAHIIKIDVNKASLEKLRSHPYLSFYQAKVIVELRKARAGLRSIQELASYREFTKSDLDRLQWYLSF